MSFGQTLVLSLALVWTSALAAQTETPQYYVAPGGVDGAYASLTAAVAAASADSACIIHVGEGRYTELTETLPITLPANMDRLTIRGSADPASGPAAPQAVFAAESGSVFVKLDPSDPGANPTRLEFVNLAFEGGLRAFSFVGVEPADLHVTVDACSFSGQKLQALELVSAASSSLDVTITNSEFRGGFLYAVDLGAAAGGQLTVDVSGNVFERESPSDGDFPLRNSVALFLSAEARIDGRIRLNRFEDVGNAILITSTGPSFLAGVIDLDIHNNFALGSDDEDVKGLDHGLYLSVDPKHEVDLRLTQNTFVSGRGAGIFIEKPDSDVEFLSFCDQSSVTVEGSVIWGFAEGVVKHRVPVEEGESFSPSCVEFRGSAVPSPQAVRGLDNVEVAATDFFDAAADRYDLAEGSRLIDMLPAVASSMDEPFGSAVDMAGNCRYAVGSDKNIYALDVGAFEFGGKGCVATAYPFRRGDCNADEKVNIADPNFVMNIIFFVQHPVLACADACDSNDDGKINIADGVFLFHFIFLGTSPPPPPFLGPLEVDLTSDGFFCAGSE